MERNGLNFNIFVWKWSKIAKQKIIVFFPADFAYKTRWKPRFPMDLRPLVNGRIANFGIFLDIFEFIKFGLLFLF